MFVDVTQQCFALLPQVTFPTNNLNFHSSDWKVMGSNPGYLHKLFFLYTNNAFGSWQLCQKFCFAQFYHSRIQVFVNCSSLVRENLRLLRENVKHKILKIVQPHETPPSAMRWLHNGDALPTNDDRITLSSAWNPKVTFLV